jgi:hypothetical protein
LPASNAGQLRHTLLAYWAYLVERRNKVTSSPDQTPDTTVRKTAHYSTKLKPQDLAGTMYTNVKSDIIQITHDKLENVLIKFYQNYPLRSAWFNPFSLAITIILTLSTTDFKANALGLDAATWKSIFHLVLVASVIWLGYNLLKLFIARKKISLEYLIGQIKNSTPP